MLHTVRDLTWLHTVRSMQTQRVHEQRILQMAENVRSDTALSCDARLTLIRCTAFLRNRYWIT